MTDHGIVTISFTSVIWKNRIYNFGGKHHSNKYGFGRVNATAAVEASLTWKGVNKLVTASGTKSENKAIAYNTILTSSIDITTDAKSEHVNVRGN